MAEFKDFLVKTFSFVSMPVKGASAVVPSSTPFFNPGQQPSSSGGEATFIPPLTLADDLGALISSVDVASITVPSFFNSSDGAVFPATQW